MKIKEVSINFTNDAEEEVAALVKDLQLIPVAQYLLDDGKPVPEDLKSVLTGLLNALSDLFSAELPGVEKDPERALRIISRDINLARLLKERGLFRLYRLLHQVDENGLPQYMSIINPDMGHPFASQEEFIGWFCSEAHVARSLVFIRLATIEKTLALGFDLNAAFKLIITKPYAIRETLNMIATWDKNELASVDPTVIMQIADRVAPELVEKLQPLADAARDNDDDDAKEQLMDAAKPVLAKLLNQVADHDRAKDAMDMVRHDILLRPEISYVWDEDMNALVIQLIKHQVDPKNGTDIAIPAVSVPFIPDIPELPEEIKTDLLKRLPIRNRFTIDNA
jgi:hypothetical protein